MSGSPRRPFGAKQADRARTIPFTGQGGAPGPGDLCNGDIVRFRGSDVNWEVTFEDGPLMLRTLVNGAREWYIVPDDERELLEFIAHPNHAPTPFPRGVRRSSR